MLVTINTTDTQNIDWAATGAAEIVQNVFTLINTFTYEVAYDRTIGIPGSFIDMPTPEAVPIVVERIYTLIDECEPRATVEDVIFAGLSEDGTLIFEVVIDV
ncbi:hypothetical protein [Paenibacillus crassostreae]|uniref:IraD/Gp25-like domain-containing protein n=1 Tax=Paenibacillus crassostreae TaxID=1763538 RepID=A0A167C5J4_9BACL|nr:hypothetical protein [Paenibacillus crassostreae]AOZ91622.1 hypothetical protein LPB68_04915 [Paenibacillus crassostreae]OAB72804.1 hypothetical protein PNBC_15335 [Paenibacillus crassostreae]